VRRAASEGINSFARWAVLAGMLAAVPTGVVAQPAGSACAAINEGFLNVELGADQADSKGVRLHAGDKLSFQFQTGDRSFGSVALVGTDKAERLLLVGPAGTGVDFVAPVSGAFDFRFAKDGIEAASFSVSCVPARLARREARRARGSRAGLLLLPQASYAEEIGEGDAPLVADAAPGQPVNLSEIRPLENSAPKEIGTGLAFKMEPRDLSRTAPGAQLDPAATGVNMGLNYQVQPAIMLGALAQIDQSGAALAMPSTNLAEHGWMLGPTAKLQLGGGLSLDAQAAWGHADSGDVGIAERGPSLPRKTVSAKLANTQTMGAWRFSPSISVNRAWDTAAVHEQSSDVYLTSTVASGRVDVGPEVAYRMDLANAAFLEPRIAFGSFWGLDGASALQGGHADMRLKAEAGVTLGIADGTKVQVGGAIEEGTATTPDAWSGRLQMSVPLK
jgi:hypothetical protein